MNIALFDFDGTITFADSFTTFLYFASGRSRILLGSALLSPLIAPLVARFSGFWKVPNTMSMSEKSA